MNTYDQSNYKPCKSKNNAQIFIKSVSIKFSVIQSKSDTL